MRHRGFESLRLRHHHFRRGAYQSTEIDFFLDNLNFEGLLVRSGSRPFVRDARAKRDAAGLDPAVIRKAQVHANIEAGHISFEPVAREWHEL